MVGKLVVVDAQLIDFVHTTILARNLLLQVDSLDTCVYSMHLFHTNKNLMQQEKDNWRSLSTMVMYPTQYKSWAGASAW